MYRILENCSESRFKIFSPQKISIWGIGCVSWFSIPQCIHITKYHVVCHKYIQFICPLKQKYAPWNTLDIFILFKKYQWRYSGSPMVPLHWRPSLRMPRPLPMTGQLKANAQHKRQLPGSRPSAVACFCSNWPIFCLTCHWIFWISLLGESI